MKRGQGEGRPFVTQVRFNSQYLIGGPIYLARYENSARSGNTQFKDVTIVDLICPMGYSEPLSPLFLPLSCLIA